MSPKRIVIAIDGPSGVGKSTAARAVAQRLGYLYVDSGAMYRAVALRVWEEGINPLNVPAINALTAHVHVNLKPTDGGVRVLLDSRDVTDAIRRPEISQAASQCAMIPEVRRLLVAQQQRIGSSGGVVMEGRDIGSVVFPNAGLKIFLDAEPEERARRRHEQHLEQGIESSLEMTRKEVEERDRRDRERAVSPLVQAPDAVYLDTTAMGAAEVVDVIVRLAEQKVEESKGRRV
ncbi:MAG: (d)CMP kinase [Candidatus Acidiferrales bacterium]